LNLIANFCLGFSAIGAPLPKEIWLLLRHVKALPNAMSPQVSFEAESTAANDLKGIPDGSAVAALLLSAAAGH